MNDAPKIDTQAPERIWAWEVDNDGWWDTDKPDWIDAPVDYIRADLTTSDWHPMETAPRDGTWFTARTASGYERTVHYADSADRLPIDHSGEIWSTVPVQWKALPDTAALDRLIAERVREAVREIKEAWDWWQADSYDRCASVVLDAIDEAMTAARGSKDGRDG